MNAPPADVPLGLVSAHSVLPQAVQVLLLQGLHRQELGRGRALPGRAVARDRAGQQIAGDGRPAVPVRLFRRRHAVVSQLAATGAAGRSAAGERLVGQGRGSDVRVRAGHALRSEGPHAARNRRHAAEPGRRALRRRNPPRERPGARVAGNLSRLAVDSGGRLREHEHRSDRRHGRRDMGQMARNRPPRDRAGCRQRHDLPDGAAVQHGVLEGHSGRRDRNAGRRLADEARLGRLRVRRARRRRLLASRAPTRW